MFYRFVGNRRKAIDLYDLYHGGTCFLVGGSPDIEWLSSSITDTGIVTMAMNNVAALFKPTLWIGADVPDNYSTSILVDPSYMKFTYISRCNHRIMDKYWKDIPNTMFFGSRDMTHREFFHRGRDFIW